MRRDKGAEMRLIDADENPCKTCNLNFNCNKTYCKKYEEWLQTAAYDIDKVAEKLFDDDFVRYDDDFVIPIDRAIEIVKQGLKEQNK